MSELEIERPGGWMDGIRPYFEKAPLAALALGISSGFPFAMIGATLTTRLAESNIEKSAVTAFALTFLAYNLKWAWAPVVDKVRLPLLGRNSQRRSWLLVTGLAVMIAVAHLGSLDPKAHLPAVAIAAICVGLAGATFDVVIDAYRIELLEPRQLGVGSGMSQYGWRIGSTAAGALALLLAGRTGWPVAYTVCALFAVPAILTGLIVGEPKAQLVERRWPERMGRTSFAIFAGAFLPALFFANWADNLLGVSILTNMVLVGYVFPVFDLSARRARDAGLSSHVTWLWLLPIGGAIGFFWYGGTAFQVLMASGVVLAIALALLPSKGPIEGRSGAVGPLVQFFRREGAWLVLLFILVHKIGDTLANLTFRLLFNDLAFTKDEIAFYDVFLGLIALFVGIFIGGILFARLGLKRSRPSQLVPDGDFQCELRAACGDGPHNDRDGERDRVREFRLRGRWRLRGRLFVGSC